MFIKNLFLMMLLIGMLIPTLPAKAATNCSCLVYFTRLTGLPGTGDPNFPAKNYPGWLNERGYGIQYYSSPAAGLAFTMDSTRSGNIYGHIGYIESASYNSSTRKWTIVLWDANFNWSGGTKRTHADCPNVMRYTWTTSNLSGLKFFKWTTCNPNSSAPFYAQYFNNSTFSSPARMIRCESLSIDRPWASGYPTWKNLTNNNPNYKVIGLSSDNFSVRWTGPFRYPSGTYRFYGGVDDKLRLYINGTKFYYTDVPKEYSTTKYISNGSALKIEYIENYYSASFSFKWIRQ